MAHDLIRRYIWIVDTLSRYGSLSRRELTELWERSAVSDGEPLPERTFFHYRRAIEENFHIDIRCDSRGKYYIEAEGDNRTLTNWLLDSYAVNAAMTQQHGASERIDVEDVPSAREFLPVVLEALSQTKKVEFTYAGFSRSRPEAGILFRPYFVKRYKQRWYMVGLREKSDDIRTYALDRIQSLRIVNETFEMPDRSTAADFFSHIIGITASKAPVRTVKLRVSTTQAKYFRALPFHHTQLEEVHDFYSIFTFRLKINYELVHELLGYGESVVVLEPRELRLMVMEELKASLANYKDTI